MTDLPISETTLLAIFAFVLVFIRGLTLYVSYRQDANAQPRAPNITLVVLGDIGRSPRMQHHALNFARNECWVDFVGYDGAKPLNSIIEHPSIKLHYISHPWKLPASLPKALYLVFAAFKVYYQLAILYWTLLFRIKSPDFVLLQNPPAIPTLSIVQFVCWLRQTNLIIDWHNFGYTILAMRLGQNSRVVKFAKWYENFFGRRAHAHLAVSSAMHRELLYKWEVEGIIRTLYDRPPTHFRRLEIEEIHKFLKRINIEETITSQSTGSSSFLPPSSPNTTLLTTEVVATSSDAPSYRYRIDRPILIVSSTSWTADEDFSILIDAAKRYDEAAEQSAGKKETFPKLLFVITGKGPLRDKYMEEISRLTLKNVRIVSLWLEAEDYPLLLGSADLGVCLHKSSSGMDLPMKVVDMFGCGLPVCAVHYEWYVYLRVHYCTANSELIFKHKKNGLVFKDAGQLTQQIIDLFKNYPVNADVLDSMREEIEKFRKENSENHWDLTILPILGAGG
ncbi:3577_t:CDS:10 [Paraglomus brasilianum]|uniref:Chitobiosyldiphosphodolichol beta-mannosyltransferase n=1 Tax=Paraglomus brasilianum TaxID=144538 RepID=A0A9N9F8F5_9GLOM|nr:3577_t:CDS:10 [Paraglomus brasilianum]